ncbi:hypothetical protein PAHAL_8G083000 [Panicum hallii]|uniref:Uncharacterized protein n=1 Tax=Panicum hallii TaxID=206008 RepID=A0A2S3IDJ4_9POAL|nr:hypothetical protein PAHAL_8G083000 [Panicum hallii]
MRARWERRLEEPVRRWRIPARESRAEGGRSRPLGHTGRTRSAGDEEPEKRCAALLATWGGRSCQGSNGGEGGAARWGAQAGPDPPAMRNRRRWARPCSWRGAVDPAGEATEGRAEPACGRRHPAGKRYTPPEATIFFNGHRARARESLVESPNSRNPQSRRGVALFRTVVLLRHPLPRSFLSGKHFRSSCVLCLGRLITVGNKLCLHFCDLACWTSGLSSDLKFLQFSAPI